MKTGLSVLLSLAVVSAVPAASASDADSIDRGRYLARITGCNDCHTPGYVESAGEVAEKDWLVGSSLGWRGPWGTTYPGNLRTYMQRLTEEQWVRTARTAQLRPPMPWFALRDMKEEDLRALYRFVRQLGPAGDAVPAYVPPVQAPRGPAVEFPPPPAS